MKDMSDPVIAQEYDEKIYIQARELSTECGTDTELMKQRLKALGCADMDIEKVNEAQTAPYSDGELGEFERELTEDDDFDEGVYEAVKDALRPLYGFESPTLHGYLGFSDKRAGRVSAFTWNDGPDGVNYAVEGIMTFLPIYCSKEQFLDMVQNGGQVL